MDGFVSDGGPHTCGCHFLFGRAAKVCRHLFTSHLGGYCFRVKALDPELDQRSGSVLNVISMLGALRLETWLGDPMLHPPMFTVVQV
jgi:hypothetical protein